MLPKPKGHQGCLLKYFGLEKFKPLQWQIIQTFIDEGSQGGEDVCAVIATGYGKSLCYQFPAFYLNKIVFVISPLIALMEDQVRALNERSAGADYACLLGTAQEDRGIKDRILALEYKLVYATPEYITRGNGLKLLQDLGHNLALVAIDEAHCISKWGHEFRPAYRQLRQLREAVPHLRLLALTGTATRRVRQDICEQLELRKPLMICSKLDRCNLELTVREKSSNLWSDLQPYLSWATETGGSVIIYKNTIKETEQLAALLTQQGLACHSYHSKLPMELKRQHHAEFACDLVKIMVATTAFGLGIDKQNVRLVVHYGAPSDMERYYQEIGRAGRDNQPAKCVLFYSEADARLNERLQHSQPLTAQRSEEMQQLAKIMQEYTRTKKCRRRFILEYFDDSATLAALRWRHNCCDNCRKAKIKQAEKQTLLELNVTEEARLLLGMLRDLNGHLGLGKLILALIGSRSKSMSKKCRHHEYFGLGAHRSIAWFKALAEHLKEQAYIKNDYHQKGKSSFGFPMPQVTLKGCCWLDNPTESMLIQPSPRLSKLLQTRKAIKSNTSTEDSDMSLDWGSDLELDLNELDEIVNRDTVWGPDPEIDFNKLDEAVAKSKSIASPTELTPQKTDLELLLSDCQQILLEEHEEGTRTRKARKRVWQYLENSYEKQPMIPKYKYTGLPRRAN